jgi:hypothetical protein
LKLDFFARRAHYIDHLAPIYLALPAARRGRFTVSSELLKYASHELNDGELVHIEEYNGETPRGDDPILVASYGDINRAARNSGRKIIHMEHGTGHAFGTAAYPNGPGGKRDLVSLFLAPNAYTASLIRMTRPTRCEVIGTPKMDPWCQGVDNSILLSTPRSDPPVIAIAFHWGDRHAKPPESGSAWDHYKEILPALKERYRLIGHGHPLAADVYRQEFERLGIEWVPNFRDVMQRADLYINDLSSTLYEFLLTGRPVVVLNAPWFRRDVYWGIRFWDYSDIGLNVEHPDQLIFMIEQTLERYGSVCASARRRAVRDLYPYAGWAAARAVEVITSYLEELEEVERVHIAK